MYPLYGYGERTAVVIDSGSKCTRCGFAGETSPRSLFLTPENAHTDKSVLTDLIHTIFYKHLLVNPKGRRIVLLESLLGSDKFRTIWSSVLFDHYEVTSIVFLPSHLTPTFALGVRTALVIDVGHSETQVLPIYENVPFVPAWQAQPLANRAVLTNLRSLLFTRCSIRIGADLKPVSEAFESPDDLPEMTVDDIRTIACFVTPLERSERIAAATPEQPFQFCPEVQFPIGGAKTLTIPGEVRETAAEILFSGEPVDGGSVAGLVLDCLLACSVDMRRQLAENLLVVGGGAMIEGFLPRLLSELRALISHPPYSTGSLAGVSEFRVHRPLTKPNVTAWFGAAIFGSLEILPLRSISREAYRAAGNKLPPDACRYLLQKGVTSTAG